jgi:hypothetical protein
MLPHPAIVELKEYCAYLGGDPEVLPDEEAERRLPLFLTQIYHLLSAKIFGRTMRLLLAKQRQHPTPAEIESHARLARNHLGPNVAFVLDGLTSFDRNRLLRKRLPFIVPYRQMFLPGVMIDLREIHGGRGKDQLVDLLSMPAQLLLLLHLQKPRAGPARFALYEWAVALGYSRMSITRAHRDLIRGGLAEASSQGKTVVMRFTDEGRALWEKALPKLRSPVQHEGYYKMPGRLPPDWLAAGLTALSLYTDLAEASQKTLAIGRQVFRLKAPAGLESVPYRDAGTVVIQQWWYRPRILSDNHTVDRLSLYLSLRHNADERIQSALSRLLEKVKW